MAESETMTLEEAVSITQSLVGHFNAEQTRAVYRVLGVVDDINELILHRKAAQQSYWDRANLALSRGDLETSKYLRTRSRDAMNEVTRLERILHGGE